MGAKKVATGLIILLATALMIVGIKPNSPHYHKVNQSVDPTFSGINQTVLNQFNPSVKEYLREVSIIKVFSSPTNDFGVGTYDPETNMIEMEDLGTKGDASRHLLTHEYMHALPVEYQPKPNFLGDIPKLKGTKYDYLYQYIEFDFLIPYQKASNPDRVLAAEAWAEIGSLITCGVYTTPLGSWYAGIFNCN